MIHGTGHNFTMTDLRIKTVKELLRKQHSLASIHTLKFDSVCSYTVLSKHCKAAGINITHEQQAGLHGLRAATHSLIATLDDKDAFDAGMKYLTRYEIDADDTEVDTVDAEAIKAEILKDLNV